MKEYIVLILIIIGAFGLVTWLSVLDIIGNSKIAA